MTDKEQKQINLVLDIAIDKLEDTAFQMVTDFVKNIKDEDWVVMPIYEELDRIANKKGKTI